MIVRRTIARVTCLLVVCAGGATHAQTLPSQPLVFGDGLLTLGGDASVSFGREDPGFFDYTDYDHSALRLFRFDLTASLKANSHFSVLGDLRTENAERPQAYAVYLRIHPWTARSIDIQIGRVPPTFGAFARRSYASDNPLIGYPLAYQYLTSLRADAVPANADELLSKRGLGWLTKYSIGNPTADRGVPLVSTFMSDTGVQFHAGSERADATVAVTTGTLSDPRVSDHNGGKQVVGRVELRPITGLVVGASGARGPFVSDAAARQAVGSGLTSDFTQTAWGGDAEYSRGYYLVRVESIVSDWRLPQVTAPLLTMPLRAIATSVEGRYKIMPGLFAAARLDHLGFSEITGASDTEPWDAPVTRIEIGAGYSIQRNLLLKVAFQHNSRDGGRLPATGNLPAVQLMFWF
jgi:hypothetical protein